jgi:hypothetical protein
MAGAAGLTRNHGLAYVLFGGPSRTVDLTWIGGSGVAIRGLDGYSLGRSCAGGGDFNGDGIGDVVLGSYPKGNTTGDSFVYILLGSKPGRFLRGDSNGSARVDLSDPIALLSHLFLGQDPVPCLDAADGNDDGTLDITDAIFVLGHLFLGGAAPPEPYPEPGSDPTPDALGCRSGA